MCLSKYTPFKVPFKVVGGGPTPYGAGGGVRRRADAEHAGAQQLGTGHAAGGDAVVVAGRQDEEIRGGGRSVSRGYTTRPGAGSPVVHSRCPRVKSRRRL